MAERQEKPSKYAQLRSLPNRSQLFRMAQACEGVEPVTRSTVTPRNTVTRAPVTDVTSVTPVTVTEDVTLQQRVTELEILVQQLMARVTKLEGLPPKPKGEKPVKPGSRAEYMRNRRAAQRNSTPPDTENGTADEIP